MGIHQRVTTKLYRHFHSWCGKTSMPLDISTQLPKAPVAEWTKIPTTMLQNLVERP